VKEIDEKVFWIPPEIWPGETVFIIGGGPSLRDFDWDLVCREKIIGANDAYMLGPWVDYNMFADSGWYSMHRKFFSAATATMIGITNQPLRNRSVKWVKRAQHAYGERPFEIPWFGNTGMACICLAVKFGAKRVCLLGFDMKIDEESGEANWHVNQLSSPNASAYARFMNWGKKLKKLMDEHHPDVEILNCNPDSAMDLWPKVKIEEVLS